MRFLSCLLLPASVCVAIVFLNVATTAASDEQEPASTPNVRHVQVFFEEGKFAAWPANGGMWSWGQEILVCFTKAEHQDSSGHTYAPATARNMFARSLDGGESWAIEDAYEQGITAAAMDHHLGHKAQRPKELAEPIDFTAPDFALLFQRETNHQGPAHFYCTYNRGRSWAGPFAFPELDPAGITNRTDYIVDGKHELLAFLSIGHGRTGVARTVDGGRNWELASYVGPDFTRSEQTVGRNEYSLMPSSIRLSPSRLLTIVRHRQRDRVWLTSYLSDDNAGTWEPLGDPVQDNVNTPPALISLPDGQLVLVYVFRRGRGDGSSVCARISAKQGTSWGQEIVLRGNDGANWDVGYPRVVRRPDGKLVLTYYWNHALRQGTHPYRYIGATIWDPGPSQAVGPDRR